MAILAHSPYCHFAASGPKPHRGLWISSCLLYRIICSCVSCAPADISCPLFAAGLELSSAVVEMLVQPKPALSIWLCQAISAAR